MRRTRLVTLRSPRKPRARRASARRRPRCPPPPACPVRGTATQPHPTLHRRGDAIPHHSWSPSAAPSGRCPTLVRRRHPLPPDDSPHRGTSPGAPARRCGGLLAGQRVQPVEHSPLFHPDRVVCLSSATSLSLVRSCDSGKRNSPYSRLVSTRKAISVPKRPRSCRTARLRARPTDTLGLTTTHSRPRPPAPILDRCIPLANRRRSKRSQEAKTTRSTRPCGKRWPGTQLQPRRRRISHLCHRYRPLHRP